MAGSFTVSIPDLSSLHIGGTKRSEAAEIAAWVLTAMQQVVAAHATAPALKDRKNNSAGTVSWVPVNTT
jgi:hypothetical protein